MTTVLADFRLPRRARRILAPLARVVLPSELGPLGLVEPVLDHVELTLRSLPAYLRSGLLAGLYTFDLAAMTRPSSFGRPFSLLPQEKQRDWFAAYWTSPVGALHQWAKGIKGILAIAYWEQPTVRAAMEYHPDRFIAEVAARRLADYADDIVAHDALVLAPDPLVPAARLARARAKSGHAS